MTRTRKLCLSVLAAIALTSALAQVETQAQEDFSKWPLLNGEFESTGGGGIMIRGYTPIVKGTVCETNFTAHEPGTNGKVYPNAVTFDATAVQGGTLCSNGRWRSLDSNATGTTPLRVFIKDGVMRRSQ